VNYVQSKLRESIFVYGINILKCHTQEKSHFCKSILCVTDVLVLAFFVCDC